MREIYCVEGNAVIKYYVLNEYKETMELIPINAPFTRKKETLFESKEDAQYQLFVHRMTNENATLDGYRKSKYYDYYVKRARKENPELLI